MKRSEMIDIMHENISSVLLTSKEFDKEDCDRLLQKMEELGMLPPIDEDIEESPVGYGAAYLSDTEVRVRYIKHFCTWEPEDE